MSEIKITNNFEKAKGIFPQEQSLSIAELFTQEFMTAHTKFSSLDDFLSYIGVNLASDADKQTLASGGKDGEISSCSDFSTWEEMKGAAFGDNLRKMLK